MNKRYSITLHEKTHELLLALAKDNLITQGQVINTLLVNFIKEQQEKEKLGHE